MIIDRSREWWLAHILDEPDGCCTVGVPEINEGTENMTDKETAQMIEHCIGEIEALRAHVAELAPAASAYRSITKILGLLPEPSQGFGEDVVWRLRKHLEELRPKAVEVAETV